MSDYAPGCFANFKSFNNFFVILTFCFAFRAVCGDKNSILGMNESKWQWLKTIEFLSGGKSGEKISEFDIIHTAKHFLVHQPIGP